MIITNGGGIGVLATDACEKYKVSLYDDQEALKKAFSSVMPEFGSTKNPVDLTGQATAEDYEKAMNLALKNDRIGSVMSLYCETALFDTEAFSKLLPETYARYRKEKPIVFSLFGGERIERAITKLRKSGIPVFPDVYEAVSCLGALYRSWEYARSPEETIEEVKIDYPAIEGALAAARADGRTFLLAHEAEQVAAALGIPTPQAIVAPDLDAAVAAAERIGYPVVMKVVSKDIIHKSDAGGVALDLENQVEVIDAYQAIMRSCRAYNPKAVIQGVEVAEMVRTGVETIIGARQDPSFGPVVMFGLGGIYVEVMKDVSFRAAPLGKRTAHSMIGEIRSYPLLLGVRGEKRKDIDAIADVAVRLGALVHRMRDITDIEINPLVVYDHGEGVKAVDVRILLKGSPGGE
ncbi:hypothetical protein DRJ12_03445 [Candidatus Acetothermia bacterium]|nr:MAG: hypothetical protein DRJ12_03445 [Candidatus Acetothermia bacterium]